MSRLFCVVLALTCCLMACKPSQPPGPPPTPTASQLPDPTPTSSTLPEIVPCHAVPPSPGIFTGDCEVTEQCKALGDGTYAGQCHTRPS